MITTGRDRRVDRWWLAGAAVATVVALVLGVLAPPDAVQGGIQKLMYVHVPAAWSAYLCFLSVLIANLWGLMRTGSGAGRLARAAAEAGVVLTALTLATGSLWGSATWGTWWIWDARITSTLAMGLVYVAYLCLDSLTSTSRGRRLTAMVGVVGFASAPLVHFSVIWWRTLHQPATVLAPSLSPPIDGRMGAALAAAVLAASLVTSLIVRLRHERLLPPASSGRPTPQGPKPAPHRSDPVPTVSR
ncbi:cytochrome c biogenesis protein CcsA [Labedella populi]|uniref:cytochrome c biogenesis protein CcsA n=1 Tax=Labedella populi TaxID=2498850 RepID=UPI00140D9CD5|nr:cytochrome c biogenesis protein CcsA [Labedella populi]